MEHAWKACIRDKRIVGSNPTSSECNEGGSEPTMMTYGSVPPRNGLQHLSGSLNRILLLKKETSV
jgi:hypothetical protein